MAYITLLDLADAPGARELSELASPEHEPVVPYELMDAALRGQDVSAWRADELERADRALQCIGQAAADADELINGYLGKRGYTLPLAPVPGLVKAWARSITRYLLHKDRRTLEDKDPIVRNWRDALRLLQLTADGRFSLGADDGVANHQTDARFCYAPNVFGRDQLKAFR